MSSRKKSVILAAASVAALSVLHHHSIASASVWTGAGGDANFSTPANWDVTPTASSPLIFDGSLNLNPFNDFAPGTTFGGITFNSGAGSFIIAGNDLDPGGDITDNAAAMQIINLNMSLSATHSFFVTDGGTLQIGGAISGGGGLTKTGNGTLILGANNSYGGETSLDGGTLVYTVDNNSVQTLNFGAASALPFSTNTSTLDLTSASVTASTLNVRTNSATANMINIGAGHSLTVNGAVTVGIGGSGGGGETTALNITGGGSFLVNAGGGSFNVGLGISGTPDSASPATLDMTGLGTFAFSGSEFRVGAGNARSTGIATLSDSANSITTGTLRVGDQTNSNPGGTNFLYLGRGDNTINTDNLFVAGFKSSGSVLFASSTGSLVLRNQAGNDRVSNLTLGTNAGVSGGSGSTSSTPTGFMILDDHPVDMLIDTLTIARRTAGGGGGAKGLLQFNNGTVDVNTIAALGFRSNGGATNGTITVGANGLLHVGGGGVFLGGSNSGTAGTGVININGGTAQFDSNINRGAGGGAGGAGSIVLNGGLLDMRNHSIGTSGDPINVILNEGTARDIAQVNDGGAVVKDGAGTLILDGTNNYTGDTIVNGGVLLLNTATAANNSNLAPSVDNAVAFAPSVGNFTVGGLSGTGNIALTDTSSAAINLQAGNNNGTQTYSGGLGGNGSLTKIGGGRLTLAGISSHTGGTTVQSGTLVVTGGLSASGNLHVNSGATLMGNMTAGNTLGHVTLDGGGAIIAGIDNAPGALHGSAMDLNGGTLQFNLGATPTSSMIDASGLINVNSNVAISVPNAAILPGQYTLLQSTSPINFAGGGSFTLFGPGGGFTYSLDTTTDNKSVFLDVTGTVAHLRWIGSADGTTWDTSTNSSAANWTNTDTNTPNQNYADPAFVTFDDAGTTTSINLTTTVTPASVTVDGSSNNYTIQGGGSIGGLVTSLTKNGTTTLTLLTNNSYQGGTTINGGTLQINSATSLGDASGDATINAATLEVLGGNITSTRNFKLGSATSAITVDGGATMAVSGVVSDGAASGRLVANGSGTLALLGTNTYTGGTSIGNNGTVQINSDSSLGTGSVLINNGTLDAVADTTSTRAVQLADPLSTIGVESGATYTLNGAVSNGATTGTLNKIGSGTLVLGSANSYTGGTNVTGGLVSISADNNLGPAPGSATPNSITLNGGGIGATGTFALSSNRGIGINGTGTINVGTASMMTYGGIVADNNGSGSLNVAGTGTLYLTGFSTYTGSTSVSNSAILQLAAGADHLPNNSSLTLGNTSALILGDNSGPASQVIGSLASGGANSTPSILGGSSSVSTLTINNGGTIQYSRGIGGPGANQNNLAIVYNGPGTLKLNAAGGANADNTYAGGTTINGGTLTATQTHGFGDVSGLITIKDGATMGIDAGTSVANSIAPYNVSVPDSANATIAPGRNNAGAGFVQTLGNLSIGSATLNVVPEVNVNSGTAGLAFSGTTTLTSAGTGTTVFNPNGSANLALAGVAGSATGGNVTMLQLDGNSSGNAITGAITNGAAGGRIDLLKNNSSTWILSGNNAYTGTTTINGGGTLLVNGTHTGGGTYTVNGGGTLGGNGTIAARVNVSNGGILNPGNSLGVLSVATLSLDSSALNFEVGPGGADKLVVTGANGLLLNGVSTFNLTDLGNGNVPSGQFALIDYSGSALPDLSNFNLGTPSLGSLNFSLFNNTANTSVDLVITGGAVASNATWNIDSDGNWSDGGAWNAPVPNLLDATANFGTIITAARTVTVDAPQVVGTINFTSPVSYTIAGSNTITLDVSSGQAGINVTAGSHTIAAPVALNDDATITSAAGSGVALTGDLTATGRTITKAGAGSVQFANVRAAGLNVSAGSAQISANATPNNAAGTSVVRSLSIASGASLDLTNNSMVIDYSGPVGTLVDDTRVMLKNNQLTSSSADANHRLGYLDNATRGLATFSGQSVDPTSILIKFTFGGDANLDGQVDVTDLGALATNWQTSNVWTGGDFNYDGFVDVTDLGILATDWQLGVGSPLGAGSFQQALSAVGLGGVSVPEPSTVTAVAFALAGFGLRRRRSRRCV